MIDLHTQKTNEYCTHIYQWHNKLLQIMYINLKQTFMGLSGEISWKLSAIVKRVIESKPKLVIAIARSF